MAPWPVMTCASYHTDGKPPRWMSTSSFSFIPPFPHVKK